MNINQKREEVYSTLKITCKDKTIRQIKCLGNYNQSNAAKLAFDIEGSNYQSVEVSVK